MFLFQDWLYQDMTDFESALEYEREHPSWQCEWDPRMANEFPVFVTDLGAEE